VAFASVTLSAVDETQDYKDFPYVLDLVKVEALYVDDLDG
jgi:hypothetical protein